MLPHSLLGGVAPWPVQQHLVRLSPNVWPGLSPLKRAVLRPRLATGRPGSAPEAPIAGSLERDPVVASGWPTLLVCLELRQFLGHRTLVLKSESLGKAGQVGHPIWLPRASPMCPPSPPPVPFRETPSYAKRRRLAGPSGLASPRPLQRSASDINLKGEVQPAASPGPTLRSLPHQLLLQRLQEEKDRDRDGDKENDVGGTDAGRGSQSNIR